MAFSARAAVVALALAVAACSGGDDPEPAPAVIEPAASATPVPTAAPSPTATATAVPEPTPTTPAPVEEPTPDEVDALEAMLLALDRHIRAQAAVGERPADDVLAEAFIATTMLDAEGFAERYVEILRRDGLAVLPNTELPSRYEILSAEVNDVRGTVETCDIDGDVVVELGGAADGSDLVVNDEVLSTVIVYELRLVAGEWLVERRERLETFEDTEGCAPPATTDPDDPAAVAMVAAMERTMAAYFELFRTPMDGERLAAVLDQTTGDMDRIVRRSMELMNERGQQGLVGDVETRLVVDDSTVFLIPGLTGGVDICYIDGDWLVELGAADDGSDLLIEDDITSYLVSVSMAVEDGVWKVSDLQFFETFEDTEGCS